MKRKRVALYVRVSTNQQTTENQVRELEQYCERQGWKVVELFDDSGISGSTDDRPELNRMMKDVRKARCPFDVIACVKIDRLARSTIDLLNILTDLKAAGVDFCAITQAIDTTTSAGRMLVTFLGAIAEFERETVVERVKSGIERAKANGVKFGRPHVSFDFNRALTMKREGYSWNQLAREFKVSSATLRRKLTPLLKT